MEETVLKLISFETCFKKIQMKNCYSRNKKLWKGFSNTHIQTSNNYKINKCMIGNGDMTRRAEDTVFTTKTVPTYIVNSDSKKK